MKILQLSYRLPYPLKDGGAIGIHNITRAFHALGNEVTLLSFNTKKHFVEPSEIPASLKNICQLELVYHNTNINPVAAFISLLQNKSYHITRFKSKIFVQKLSQILQRNQFDFIEMEGVFLGEYLPIIRKFSKAKIIVRAHNVEHHIWQQLATNADFPKNIYLKILAAQLKKFEIEVWKNADVVAAINEEELQFIQAATQQKKVHLFPAGIFMNDFKIAEKQIIPFSLFHIGSMEWMPNIEGVDWFLKNVFPKIKQQIPQAIFYLAGRKMPQKYFAEKQNGVEIIGEVNDALEFMNNKQLMIVPLLSGGGVRIKILEAMAMGKPVVATSQAAMGLNCIQGENILITDDVEEMAQTIIAILQQLDEMNRLKTNAQLHIQNHFDQINLLKKFLKEIAEK